MFDKNNFINWTNSARNKNMGMSDFRNSFHNPSKQLDLVEIAGVIPALTTAAKTIVRNPTVKKVAKDTALSMGTELAKKKLTRKKRLTPDQQDELDHDAYETELEHEVKEEGRGSNLLIKPKSKSKPKAKFKPSKYQSRNPWDIRIKSKLKNRDRSTIRHDHVEHDGEEINEIGFVGAALGGAAIGGGIALTKKLTKWQRKGQDRRATASHDAYGGAQDRPYNFGDKRRETGHGFMGRKVKPTRTPLSKGGGRTDPDAEPTDREKHQAMKDKLAQIAGEEGVLYNPQGTELAEGLLSGIAKGALAAGAGYAAYKGAGALMNKFSAKRAVANAVQTKGSPSTPVASSVQSGLSKLKDAGWKAAQSAGKTFAKSGTGKGIAGDLLSGGRKLATSGVGGKIGGWAAKSMGAAGGVLKKAGRV